MQLVLSGASGFIGSALCPRLLQAGHTLVLLTHGAPPNASTPGKRWSHWTPGSLGEWAKVVDGADGVINLAGEPIAERKWSYHRQLSLQQSRYDATRSIVLACQRAKQKPKFLLNASAIGYYGPRQDEILNEETPPGNDFLANLCLGWEAEAISAESLGMRVIRLRTGIVLGSGGGALVKMAEPFKWFVGGPIGSGKQWMSWIHLEDEVNLILHLIDNQAIAGPVNATAPNPVRNKEFCQMLAAVLHRPCWLPVPGFALQLGLGKMAEMVLTGQRVMPAVALKSGFKFRYPKLKEALEACKPL
jgi:uncharacterized protein (TIGR01777 family)